MGRPIALALVAVVVAACSDSPTEAPAGPMTALAVQSAPGASEIEVVTPRSGDTVSADGFTLFAYGPRLPGDRAARITISVRDAADGALQSSSSITVSATGGAATEGAGATPDGWLHPRGGAIVGAGPFPIRYHVGALSCPFVSVSIVVRDAESGDEIVATNVIVVRAADEPSLAPSAGAVTELVAPREGSAVGTNGFTVVMRAPAIAPGRTVNLTLSVTTSETGDVVSTSFVTVHEGHDGGAGGTEKDGWLHPRDGSALGSGPFVVAYRVGALPPTGVRVTLTMIDAETGDQLSTGSFDFVAR